MKYVIDMPDDFIWGVLGPRQMAICYRAMKNAKKLVEVKKIQKQIYYPHVAFEVNGKNKEVKLYAEEV